MYQAGGWAHGRANSQADRQAERRAGSGAAGPAPDGGGIAAGSTGLGSAAFESVTEALRAGDAVADYLNLLAAAGLDGPAYGEVLRALGEIQGKLAAAYA